MIKDFIFEIYKDKRTVFNLQEIALIVREPDFARLKQRIHYYLKSGKLLNIRRGIYAKDNYSAEELACKIYTPGYISLDYVLRKSGMIFQYDECITIVSYLRRSISVDGYELKYRKIKNDILYNAAGITVNDNGISIASPERAFLDILYLNIEFHFDSIHNLKLQIVFSLLSIYQSDQLSKRVKDLLQNVGYK